MSSSHKDFYARLIEEHGVDQATGWNSGYARFQRYAVICEHLVCGQDTPYASVLDYGCNVGGLYFYALKRLGIRLNYCGMDQERAFIKRLQEKSLLPGGEGINQLIIGDVNSYKKELPVFDFVVASGVFCHESNPLEQTMDRLWASTGRALIVNFLTHPVPNHGWRYMCLDDITDLLKRYEAPFTIRRDYLENDVTVILYRSVRVLDNGPYDL